MGAQDRTEKVLKDIHMLFSKAESYNGSKKKVVVDKSEMMDLLKELNTCMFEMQEEYEMTVQSRDKAARLSQKEGEDIIFESRKNADDIYAASIMYTDRALHDIRQIIDDANKDMEKILQETQEKLTKESGAIRRNQSELKGKLQDLVDTDKYLRLIEDENIRLAKAEDLKRKGIRTEDDEPVEEETVAVEKPEIKINTDYFKSQGIPLDSVEEDANSQSESDMEEIAMNSDLDNEYFAWKEETDTGDKAEDDGLMGKAKGFFGIK